MRALERVIAGTCATDVITPLSEELYARADCPPVRLSQPGVRLQTIGGLRWKSRALRMTDRAGCRVRGISSPPGHPVEQTGTGSRSKVNLASSRSPKLRVRSVRRTGSYFLSDRVIRLGRRRFGRSSREVRMRSRDTRVASFPFVLQQSAENRWARTPRNSP
jgi:hypothetical protein